MMQTKNKIIGILFGTAFLFVVVGVLNTQQATATHCGIYDDYGTCMWYPYHEPELAPYVPPVVVLPISQTIIIGGYTVQTSEANPEVAAREATQLISEGKLGETTLYPGCGNTHYYDITGGGTPSSGGGGGAGGSSGTGGGDGGSGGASATPPAPPQTYTHYSVGSWSACGGYDSLTGQGGAQTRSVSGYSDTNCCNDSAPSSSQSCNMPPDFNMLLAPVGSQGGGGEGGGVLGNTYSTYVTFIGGQQKKLSAPVTIAINPIFPNHPSLPNLTFSVVNVLPSLPPGVEYFFNPNPLTPTKYANGTEFTIDVPRTEPGLYTITLEISGGGLVKQATVNLNVSLINPTFKEI